MFVIIAYPLFWAVGMSLNPGRSMFSASMIPENWSLEHYKWLFVDDPRDRYVTWYKNSLIVAGFTSFFSVVVALFQFMMPFMDFLLPRIVLRSEENFTLALGLFNFVSNEFDNNFTRFAAGAILLAIPIALVFLFLQRYLIAGLTAGGTKG
ncbi:hypothetical protein CR203_06905 [Salipaludibacillus neizhouensis]|uniref:ABC transmembrane type-1 domain-containing protein n=1 Tax=Salipaludibacillus neizhouensis TaxID=885475 RepID=A0A3A9K7L4_9BACI|nr:hypothetical protein [Salipaludibacillus neizhouensis]RKL68209.1 hypothetical protein CR203_06905 [Salipaludibacillus neizhouensis]